MSESLLTVNDYFNQVYLLNLDRRPDRLDKVSKKLEKFNIKFKRFSAIDGNDLKDIVYNRYLENKYALACLYSHIEIVKDAKLNKFKKILIMEDDILISENFNEHFQKIKLLNDNWKMLYFGSSQYDKKSLKYVHGHFYHCKNTMGTFCYALHEDIYDDIINQFEILKIENQLVVIDLVLSKYIQTKHYDKSFCMFPNIVIADVGDSDIRSTRNLEIHKRRMRWNLIKDFV